MDTVKRVLKRLGVYGLLMGITVFFCAGVPELFFTRGISTIYLLAVCVGLIVYDSYRVSRSGGIKLLIEALSWMELLFILLRGVKYNVFSEVGVLARHTWYLYYVPMLFIPLFLVYISLLVSETETRPIAKKWYWMLAVTVVLVLMIVTNDLHGQAFRFQPDFANWDSVYSYGWIIPVALLWEGSLYLASFIMLVKKCCVSSSRKNAWLILIPFAVGISVITISLAGNMPKWNGRQLIHFPETLVFMVAGVVECCMQLGMIPTNISYKKLFRVSSVAAQITDSEGNVIYKADAAALLTPEQLAAPDRMRIGTHTLLRRMEVPGGVGFWQDDVSELDSLNHELVESRERLADEVELTRLQNELQEKRAKLEQRTYVYDAIAEHTKKQSQAICRLAEAARQSENVALKDLNRRKIALLGAYIKRYANLMLLSEDNQRISVGEFALSVSEVLRYLIFYGTPGELVNTADGSLPAEAVLRVFEAFETLLEENLPFVSGVCAHLSVQGDAVLFKLTLENRRAEISEEARKRLLEAGIRMRLEHEDDMTYIRFALPKGEKAA